MRLFGYIVIFVDDVRDDERTIWCHTHWGRGGFTVIAHHCCGPARGRGGPSPAGLHYRGPARGRGGSSPVAPPITVPPEEEDVPVSL
jgi:hypothetical protein